MRRYYIFSFVFFFTLVSAISMPFIKEIARDDLREKEKLGRTKAKLLFEQANTLGYEADEMKKQFKADVLRIMSITQNNLGTAKLLDGSEIGDKVDSLNNPLISFEVATFVYDVAVISAMAETCALDWEGKNYLPLMQYLRKEQGFSEYQMAYVGLMHGITMGSYEGTIKQSDCDDKKEIIRNKLLLN